MENRSFASRFIVVGLTLCAATGATFAPPSATTLEAAQKNAHHTPIAERLRQVTEPLVGAPYVLNPLGEGHGIDADPRFRTDAFDCTTFVETALALAHTTRLDDARTTMDTIRYQGATPTLVARRHFPAAEWLPELIAAGYLEDVTRQVAGDEVVVAKKELNATLWAQRRKKILNTLPAERIPSGTFALDVWPIGRALAGYRRIPPGTVLSVVRADYRSIPVRVSHQGLVVEKNGKLFLRHAADRIYHRVVDEPLANFLLRNTKYQKWPVSGIHLAKVQEPKASTVGAIDPIRPEAGH